MATRHTHCPTRREVLRQAAALVGAALLPAPLVAQRPGLTAVPLSPRMSVMMSPNANVLAADTADGVVLVDGGPASGADTLLQTVHRVSG